MTTTPTDDLRARLHSANTLFERMLRECARPVTGSPEGVPWLAAEAYREVAIAALSAPPAGGEPVEDLANRVEGIAAWMGHRFGTGCVEADHASLLWQIAKDMRRSLTTPQPSAAEPNKTCGVCGSHRIRKHPKGTECMDCRTIHHHHAAVGTQGEFEDLLLCLQRTTEVLEADERSVSAEFVRRAITLIRRLAAPAAGNGVDDASERQPDGYAYRYADGFIRHNGGRDHNGMRPTETIPFYYGSAPALTRQPEGKGVDDVAAAVERLKDRTFPQHECPAESAAVWNVALYELEAALTRQAVAGNGNDGTQSETLDKI